MIEVKSVEDLDVFQRSHKLTLELYKISEDFPSSEKFGLVSQIRRASSSICANLLEGSYRINTKEFRQFIGVSNGSVGELKYHILLAKDLGYIEEEKYDEFIIALDTISKMLRGLIKSLSRKITNTNTNTSTNTNTHSKEHK
ncbi:four helix bundle protein [Flexistipes sp.]|uniref:four helix bundle protein n=1 Tax=Flexistipes sp. TaxID=3088135 RepID=UPI002E1DCE9D|nr:four helix bundle protein [Flexistipes sp.]